MGKESDMAVDLNELAKVASAERFSRQSDTSTSFLQAMDRKFLQVYTETDPVQSASIKEIQRGQAPDPTQAT